MEIAKAETTRPGDRIMVTKSLGYQTVLDVEPGDEVVVWYALRGEHAWSRGPEHDPNKLVERMLTFRRGDLVALERGNAGDADILKDEIARDVAQSLRKTGKRR